MNTTTKIFITGADGFIGSHLTERLVKAGYSVRALYQYNSYGRAGWLDDIHPRVIDSTELVAGDIRDSEMMSSATKGCDVIIHLAALIAIPYSYQAPQSYVETNVMGTLNMLCR